MIPVIIGVLLLGLNFCFSLGAMAQIEPIGSFESFNEVGDYIEMSFWTDEDGFDMSGHMRIELTHDKTVTVQGESYDCRVTIMKGSGEFDSGFGPKGTWEVSGKQYSDKSDGRSVKSESVMDMIMTYLEETVKMKTETTTELMSFSTNWTSEENPVIGDFWMETVEEETTTINTANTPDGIETETDTETEITITYYAYIGEEDVDSDLGKIECRVIQNYDEDDIFFSEDNYIVTYMDKELNIPVKTETYEYGEPVLTMELIAYKIGSDKAGTEVIGPIGGEEEDRGLFGMGKIAGVDISLIVIIAVLALIFLLIAVLLLRGHKEPESTTESQYTVNQSMQPKQPPQYQQPVQPPTKQQQPPPPPPPVPTEATTFNCPHCGKPFSAQPTDQAQMVYCPSCRGQVTINPQQQPQLQQPSSQPTQPHPQPPPSQQPSEPPPPTEEPLTEFQLLEPPDQHEEARKEAIDILKMRLAKGEIDLKVYRELKKELE
jgi:uncharacterized membrane protein